MSTGTRYDDPNRTANIIFNLFFPFILPLCLVSARVKHIKGYIMNPIKDNMIKKIIKGYQIRTIRIPGGEVLSGRSQGHPLPPLSAALHNKPVMEYYDGGKLS